MITRYWCSRNSEKRIRECFDPSTLLRTGKLSMNGTFLTIQNLSPLILSLSKDERFTLNLRTKEAQWPIIKKYSTKKCAAAL